MNKLILLFSFVVFSSCNNRFHIVYPVFETQPVNNQEDAADDIAIFADADDPSKHAIIGTNKKGGLVVYDSKGKILHDYTFGKMNNVDIRQDITWGKQKMTIVGCSNRTDNSIVFYKLNPQTLELTALHKNSIYSDVNEVYGFCMYYSEECYAFVVGKDGVVEQWLLEPDSTEHLRANKVRSFDVGGQCEGLVADDQLHFLYVGEEDQGIWKYNAKPTGNEDRISVCSIKDYKNLKADIEGLTILYRENNEGYLIASSQGNNSYAVFDRQKNNPYIGSFKIKSKGNLDGTEDTDGIDVIAKPFGPYEDGVFIAQDGFNKKENQNFKVVDLGDIEKKLLHKD